MNKIAKISIMTSLIFCFVAINSQVGATDNNITVTEEGIYSDKVKSYLKLTGPLPSLEDVNTLSEGERNELGERNKERIKELRSLKERLVNMDTREDQRENNYVKLEIKSDDLYCNEIALNLYGKAKIAKGTQNHNEESLILLISANDAGHPFAFLEFFENFHIWKNNPILKIYNNMEKYYKESKNIKKNNSDNHDIESLKKLQYAALLGHRHAECEFLEGYLEEYNSLFQEEPYLVSKKFIKIIEKHKENYKPGYFWYERSRKYHSGEEEFKEREFLKKAAERKHRLACYEYGKLLVEHDNIEEGLGFLQTSADDGHKKSQDYLKNKGKIFFDMYNSSNDEAAQHEKNSEQYLRYKNNSIGLLKRAALYGHPKASYRYGEYLMNIENKFMEGRNYILRAEKAGDDEAEIYIEENPHVYYFNPFIRKLSGISEFSYRVDQVNILLTIGGFMFYNLYGNKYLSTINHLGQATKVASGFIHMISGVSNFLLRGHKKYIWVAGSGFFNIANTAYTVWDDYGIDKINKEEEIKLQEIKETDRKINAKDIYIREIEKLSDSHMKNSKNILKYFEDIECFAKGAVGMLSKYTVEQILKQEFIFECAIKESQINLIMDKMKLIEYKRNIHVELENIILKKNENSKIRLYFHLFESIFHRFTQFTNKNIQDELKGIEKKYGLGARHALQGTLILLITCIEIQPRLNNYSILE